MTIKRGMVEIELTDHELYQAYCEQEHIFDLETCENEFDMRYCDESWYEDVSDEDRDTIIDELADSLRRILNRYDFNLDHAIDAAFENETVKKIIKKYEEGSK